MEFSHFFLDFCVKCSVFEGGSVPLMVFSGLLAFICCSGLNFPQIFNFWISLAEWLPQRQTPYSTVRKPIYQITEKGLKVSDSSSFALFVSLMNFCAHKWLILQNKSMVWVILAGQTSATVL